MSLRRRALSICLVSSILAACSASSSVNPPNDGGQTGGKTSTGGATTGGSGGSGATGGNPTTGGTGPATGGAPNTGGSGGGTTDPVVQGCTDLCNTILGAGCPNGPGLNACVQNCVTAGDTCKAAQQCFVCTGTAPRVACDDAGVPQVPDCPECKDVADRCAAPDASVDSGADASNGARDAAADAPEHDGAPTDAEADAKAKKKH